MSHRRAGLVAGLLGLAAAGCAGRRPAGADAVATGSSAQPPVLDAALGEVAWPDEQRISGRIAAAIRSGLEQHYPPGTEVRRDAHPKAHGCVRAVFRVEDALQPELAHGVFVPGRSYDAWVRFSNGNPLPDRADAKGDARGMALKLLGVPGDKLLERERDADTQDFVLINHPVFFVDDPLRYLRLFERGASRNPVVKLAAPLALRPREMALAARIASSKIANPLEVRYWSTVPYRLGPPGEGLAVKYSVRPSSPGRSVIPRKPDRDFLRHAMADTLAFREARFDVLVQPRRDPSMSVEDSRTEWSEAEAPFVKVATLTVAAQVFDTPEQRRFCEDLSFNPWHALPEHRPLGIVNRVRRVVYEAISAFRHERNGRPRVEPGPGTVVQRDQASPSPAPSP